MRWADGTARTGRGTENDWAWPVWHSSRRQLGGAGVRCGVHVVVSSKVMHRSGQTVELVCSAAAGELGCAALGSFPGCRILVDNLVFECLIGMRFIAVESKPELFGRAIDVSQEVSTLVSLHSSARASSSGCVGECSF